MQIFTWTLQKLEVHVADKKIKDTKISPCPVDKVNLELRSRLLQEINEAEDVIRREAAKLATEKGAAAITDHFEADTSKETAADSAILEILVPRQTVFPRMLSIITHLKS